MTKLNGEVDNLWTEFWQTHSGESINRLTEAYLHLVKYSADRLSAKIPCSIMDADDFYQEGYFALRSSIKRYDPQKKVKFETFAQERIIGSMLDSIRSHSQVSRLILREYKKLDKTANFLRNKCPNNGNPSPEELREYLGMSERKFYFILNGARKTVSIEDIVNQFDEKPKPWVAYLSGKLSTPEEIAIRTDIKNYLIRSLNKTDRLIFTLLYYEGLTLAEIGEVVGLSRSRVSQIHNKILSELRRKFAEGDESLAELLRNRA